MSEAEAPAAEVENADAAPVAEPQAPAIEPDKPQVEAPVASSANWKDSLPDDIKSSPTLEKFDTLEGLTKSYINLEKTLGSEKIPVPKSEEDWDKWYKAGGRPDSPDGYQFEKPTNIPEGMDYSPELDKTFATWAHETGMNGKQAQAMREKLLDYLASGQTQAMEQASIKREEAEAKLKSEWGRAYDQNLKAANSAMKKFAGDEFAAFLDGSGLGDHPAMVKAFAQIAKATMGEKELYGESQEAAPSDIEQQIADHAKRYQAELMDKSHPDHMLRVNERNMLFQKRYG